MTHTRKSQTLKVKFWCWELRIVERVVSKRSQYSWQSRSAYSLV